MGGFDVSCALWSRWAGTVLDLILFLGGCSSNGKVRDVGWATLFLSAIDFFSLTGSWGIEFVPISVDVSKGDFTSEWVYVIGTISGVKNSYLSSLRNA